MARNSSAADCLAWCRVMNTSALLLSTGAYRYATGGYRISALPEMARFFREKYSCR